MPDGRLVFVSSPDEYNYHLKQQIKLDFLQVIDLEASSPKLVNRINLGSHPQGPSVSPGGKMLLAATVDGEVAVLSIESKRVVLVDKLKVAKGKLSGISFTHDSKAALVALRDEQGISVLEVRNGKVTPAGEWISTCVTPYVVDVSSDGKWAVVSIVGLAAIEGRTVKIFGLIRLRSLTCLFARFAQYNTSRLHPSRKGLPYPPTGAGLQFIPWLDLVFRKTNLEEERKDYLYR
jgi:DNA-binding beta-propeller fold protein YncE